MHVCMQFGTLSVLEHGRMVTEAFDSLRSTLRTGLSPAHWRVPRILLDEPDVFSNQLLPADQMYAYQLYHDCGKPACRTTDDQGRVHFPDHARISEQIWLKHQGHPAVGRLIGLDMAMHLASADDMARLAKLPEAASLYLTAVAEVHANAEMFGGFQSPSFLAKAKHLDRRGKALMRAWGYK